MDSLENSWWHRHRWTVLILLTSFSLTFFLRTVWMEPVIAQFGPLFVYGGGSDSFYHSRVMDYIIVNHRNLILDPMLRYPIGAINPREPLFDWMNAVLGLVFAPFFGGSALTAGAFFLDLQGPLWSALSVFPVYWIGREVFSKRTGLIGALIFPFLVADIESSTFGYANYLSFYTFFILIVIFSALRTLHTVSYRRYVGSYRRPRELLPALREFARRERKAVKWAVFTGVSFGALAMAWQGYSYAVAVVAVFIVAAMVIERIRRLDSFGLYVSTWIIGLVGFPIAMPYYLAQGQFAGWFDIPLLVFFGALLLLLPFLFLRDVPWVFSIPMLIAIVLAGVGILALVSPTSFANILSGQGYFVKTLIYSTVAEAQAPSIDSLILGYGVVTFFLAFVGLAFVGYELVHQRFRRWHILFVVFAILSIYLPITAAKFFLIASPAFALLAAEPIRRALDVGNYPELRRTAASLADRRSQFAAFRRAFKLRHLLVMLLVVGILLPNIWYSIDAGIPYNTKDQYGAQIQATLPPALRSSQGASAYLGAAGTQLDTPAQYDEDGYNWLATQDTNLGPAQRPAFVSWWDYGFQAVAQGDHPTVADNFQNGIEAGGNFLLAQNESLAIGVLATQLLYAETLKTHEAYLPAGLNAILARDGVDLATLHNLLANTSYDHTLVVNNPAKYLPVTPGNLDLLSAMFLAVSYFLADTLSISGVANVYNDIQAYTGWSIRYGMVDSRLFPFSGSDTGIFYAPADLTGRVIASGGVPTTFFNVTVLGSDGNTYPLGSVPPSVQPVNYNINYFDPFYDSMLYHIFIGYNGTDVGQSAGIPGLSQATSSLPIEPGWMLQHFQVVYRTTYYCPSSAQAANPNCYVAKNLPIAESLANKTGGVVQNSPGGSGNIPGYFSGGETILEYYPGQSMLGTVALPNGAPVAGARVTVYDSWGIPHMSVLTSTSGTYSVVLPPGNDTLNVTSGPVNGLLQAGTTVLASERISVTNAQGLSFDSLPVTNNIVLKPGRVEGFVYWNNAGNSTFIPSKDVVIPGATVTLNGTGLATYRTRTDSAGSFLFPTVSPGVYNFSIVSQGSALTNSSTKAYVGNGATVNQTTGVSPGVVSGTVKFATGNASASGALVSVASASGVYRTAVADASGDFRISSLGPGNYTAVASLAALGLRSAATPVSITGSGDQVTKNLTLAPMDEVELTVLSNGNPVPNLPVQFNPIPSFANANESPIKIASDASANASVYPTGADGIVDAWLPAGNYTAYAAGYEAGGLTAAFESIFAGPSSLPIIPGPLALSPAATVTGRVPVAGGASTALTQTVVAAYNARGDAFSSWTDTSGTFRMTLPLGSYGLYALQGTTNATGTTYAALAPLTLSGTASVTIPVSVATAVRFQVGAALPSLAPRLYPAPRAQVTVSAGAGGPAVTTLSQPNGNVSLYLPTALGFGGSYCLSVVSQGFAAYRTCGLPSGALAALRTLPLGLRPVAVSVAFSGFPSASSVTLNLTAESPSAQNATVTGTPPFYLVLNPGEYAVSAWAPAPSGTNGIYLPSGSTVAIAVPLGAFRTNVSILLLHNVAAVGTIVAPPDVVTRNVTVRLSSPLSNLTVNGSAFESHFLVAPGTYSAYATGNASGRLLSNLTMLTVSSGGYVSTPLTLNAVSASVSGNLTLADGTTLNATAPLAFLGPGGTSAPATVTDGTYTASLPANASYSASFRATALVPFERSFAYESFSVAPGYRCNVTSAASTCDVPLVGIPQTTGFNGSLADPGYGGPIAGSLRLVGPGSANTVTTVDASSGRFSVSLLPGLYSVYATGGGGGALLANLSTVLVDPTDPAPLTIYLHPTWTDVVRVTGPLGIGPTATLTVENAEDARVVFPGLSVYTPVSLALPLGSYTMNATGSGAPYGVSANATGSTSVTISTGNQATTVALAYVFRPTVAVSVVAPTSIRVAGGATVVFAYTARNTGDGPVTVHLVGAPSFWSFAFTTTNVTLAVGGTLSGEVTVGVPFGTLTNHDPMLLEAELSNGTIVGTSNAPTVQILPYYGVRVGAIPSTPANLAPTSAAVPFFVENTGNTFEGVRLTIADQARLAALGWTSGIYSGSALAPVTVQLTPGGNSSYDLKITAPSGIAVPPGTVGVLATVTNTSGSVSVALPLPPVSVSVNTTPVAVTGPSIGAPSAYPDWLVPLLAFVPAIALVVGVVSWRWLRTRRWTRR